MFLTIRVLCLFLMLFLIKSCAVPGTPSGGPKDTQPPKMLNVNPKIGAINIKKGQEIKLVFDEYVKLSDLSKLKITPPLDKTAYNISIKRNEMSLLLKGDLEENTTYQINFKDLIVDVNESNKLNGFVYVFSTGNKIDSLSIIGRLSSEKEKLESNTIVLLYPDSSGFTKAPPLYSTTVSETGGFEFNYLKKDTFWVYALMDINGNSFYDLPGEKIGFLKKPILPIENPESIDLSLFLPEEKEYRVVDYNTRTRENKVKITFNKEIHNQKDIEFCFLEDSIEVLEEPFVNEKEIILHVFGERENQSKLVILINKKGVDTLTINRKIEKIKPTLKLKSERILSTDTLLLVADQLLKEQEQIYAFIRDTGKNIIQTFDFSIRKNALYFGLDVKDLLEGDYFLELKDSSILGLYESFSDSANLRFTIKNKEKLSKLDLTLSFIDTSVNHILNIYNFENELILSKKYQNHSIKENLKYLESGNYTLEIIRDRNNNGYWNSGNFSTKTYPEEKTHKGFSNKTKLGARGNN